VTREFQHAPKIVQIGRRANPAETVTQLVYEVPKHLKWRCWLHLLKDPQLNMVLRVRPHETRSTASPAIWSTRGSRRRRVHSNRRRPVELRVFNKCTNSADLRCFGTS